MSASVSFVSYDGTSIPSPDEARRRFVALGEDFWKQIVDERYHRYGPWVFDQKLHGLWAEPGFYESLKKGFEGAADSLTHPLTMNFYKKLHSVLCEHFDGEKTGTEIGKDAVGKFRERGSVSWSHSVISDSKDAQRHYRTINVAKRVFDPSFRGDLDLETRESLKECLAGNNPENATDEQLLTTLSKQVDLSARWYGDWEFEWKRRVAELRGVAGVLKNQLGIPPYIDFLYREGKVSCTTLANSTEALDKIVNFLFQRYEKNMASYNQALSKCREETKKSYSDDKLREIASLFQYLEWIHPFGDGQGRTDLVLLSKLLTEQGFSPAILEDPYMSSFSTLDDWVNYLKKGMGEWQVALKNHRRAKEVQPMKDE